ncbi:MAG: type II toxin-antitoxin system RelE/ParE family toxin [bacterium]|nr:type II toxin-antitoxin system RelE/ParE family toxin [bacterium]
MHKVIYSQNAIKDLYKLDKVLSERIIKKIHFFSQQKDIHKFAKPLKDFGQNKYRFRIGDYRAIFKIDQSGKIAILMILNIKHRKEIYSHK